MGITYHKNSRLTLDIYVGYVEQVDLFVNIFEHVGSATIDVKNRINKDKGIVTQLSDIEIHLQKYNEPLVAMSDLYFYMDVENGK